MDDVGESLNGWQYRRKTPITSPLLPEKFISWRNEHFSSRQCGINPRQIRFGVKWLEKAQLNNSFLRTLRQASNLSHPTKQRRFGSKSNDFETAKVPAKKSTTNYPRLVKFPTKSIIQNNLFCSGLGFTHHPSEFEENVFMITYLSKKVGSYRTKNIFIIF